MAKTENRIFAWCDHEDKDGYVCSKPAGTTRDGQCYCSEHVFSALVVEPREAEDEVLVQMKEATDG